MKPSQDIKLQALLRILSQEVERQHKKAIVFCERRATLVYLHQALEKLMPSLKILCTVESSQHLHYELKETKEIEAEIKKFAPIANDEVINEADSYDILLSTDAHGIGLNLQDASVVINYDIDWTPISLIQRAGRVLRFWHCPRTVQLYTFIPQLTNQNQYQRDLVDIQRRWETLLDRHQESRKLTELPVVTTADTQEVNLIELASQVTIRSGQLNYEALADFDISPYYKHTAKLQQHRDYAHHLPDDITSAKCYSSSTPCLYLLILYNQKYHSLLYYPNSEQLVESKDIQEILNLIEADPQTPIASVDPDLIEALSHQALEQWCKQCNVPADEVERICTLYLVPEQAEPTFGDWLDPNSKN